MTTVQEVRPLVYQEISNVFAREDFTDLTKFSEDLGGDSLDVTDLAFRLEGILDIDIPDADIDNLKTVGEAVAYCERKVEKS